MNKLLLFIPLLFLLGEVKGQSDSLANSRPLAAALKKLNRGGNNYDPAAAIDIYKAAAQNGDAQAMYELGALYRAGTHVAADLDLAVKWLAEASEKGHTRASAALGIMYREGTTVPQDFRKSVYYFSKGKGPLNYYSLGYMKYKGLGCPHSYEEAIQFFRKGIQTGSLGSMYMLGLCFRNGYGITANKDSARHWISLSASKGYRYAKEEMEQPEPENLSLIRPVQEVSLTAASRTAYPKHFSSVKHSADKSNLSGNYEGYIIRYDWSGKYIIGRSELRVRLERSGNTVTGEWEEDGKLFALLEGKLSDSSIVFTNTSYQRLDHYNANTPAEFEFRDARLQLVKNAGEYFIGGTLQLYSLKQREPEKPIYISLSRRDEGAQTSTTFTTLDSLNKLKVNSLKIYPNPFRNLLNVEFALEKPAKVTVGLYNTAGLEVYSSTRQLGAGKQNLEIQADIIPGPYVLRLRYENQVKTAVVIRQ